MLRRRAEHHGNDALATQPKLVGTGLEPCLDTNKTSSIGRGGAAQCLSSVSEPRSWALARFTRCAPLAQGRLTRYYLSP